MKNQFTMLVVEDNAGHLEDCRAMLKEVCPALSVEVRVLEATNLKEALKLLPEADLVMTDVFFPADEAGAEEPNGMTVVQECLRHSKPVVWVTSTYHHGHKTEPVSGWGRARGLEMFDCNPSSVNGEELHKPWKKAFIGLLCLNLVFEAGYCWVENGKIVGLPHTYPELVAREYLQEGSTRILEGQYDVIIPLFLELNIPR